MREAHEGSSAFRNKEQLAPYLVIPGLAKREPGIHSSTKRAEQWIPGSRQEARPGMTSGAGVPHRADFLPGRFSARSAPVLWTLERGAIGAPRG
ncbi:hypothetical protein ACVW17_001044 [Bradyrhizobium sp. USDA 4473]